MDLLATVSDSNEVALSRLNGQRVWNINPQFHRKKASNVMSLSWRPDVLGFENGAVQYYDVYEGKAVSAIAERTLNQSRGSISLLAWIEGGQLDPSTYRYLNFDIRDQLPHLSPLSNSSSAEERIFTDRNAIETLIHGLEEPKSSLNFLFVSDTLNNVQMVLGSFVLNLPIGEASKNLIAYDVSADLINHILLAEDDNKQILLDTYRMGLFQHTKPSVNVLISTYQDFDVVSSYLAEAVSSLNEEWQAIEEARGPLLSKYCTMLGDNSPRDEMFRLFMTGFPSDTTKQWLQEELTERTLKKWEKSCTLNLANIRRLAFEHCLPASERLLVMLSKLRGLARWENTQAQTQLQITAINSAINTITVFMGQMHALMKSVNLEIQLFTAFTSWLGFIFDLFSAEDDEDADPASMSMGVESERVVDYIENHFPTSKVSYFFKSLITDVSPLVNRETDGYEKLPQFNNNNYPTVSTILAAVVGSGRNVFVAPAELLNKQWLHTDTNVLCDVSDARIRTHFIEKEEGGYMYLILCISGSLGSDELIVMRKPMGDNQHMMQLARLDVQFDDKLACSIDDLEIVDQYELMILYHNRNTGKGIGNVEDLVTNGKGNTVISLNYDDLPFSQVPHELHSTIVDWAREFVTPTAIEHIKTREFEDMEHPIRMQVNGRKGRRVGCILYQDRQRYLIIDLDTHDDEEDNTDDGED